VRTLSKLPVTAGRAREIRSCSKRRSIREPHRRSEFLDTAITDEELREEVPRLLEAHERSAELLDRPPLVFSLDPSARDSDVVRTLFAAGTIVAAGLRYRNCWTRRMSEVYRAIDGNCIGPLL
jgi:hypothetical protein